LNINKTACLSGVKHVTVMRGNQISDREFDGSFSEYEFAIPFIITYVVYNIV